MSRSEFHAWCTSHCPRLLDGVIQWIMTSLLLATPTQLEGVGHGAESGETVHTSSEESKVHVHVYIFQRVLCTGFNGVGT